MSILPVRALTHDCSIEHAEWYLAQNGTTVQNCTLLEKPASTPKGLVTRDSAKQMRRNQ
jgi:hypothetical protein